MQTLFDALSQGCRWFLAFPQELVFETDRHIDFYQCKSFDLGLRPIWLNMQNSTSAK